MKKFLLIAPLAAMALALPGCMTASRIAIALAPTASVGVNARVAVACVQAAQTGTPVDQRRQVRADFAGIAYDMEISNRTSAMQQEGVDRARELRRNICPPTLVSGVVEAETPVEGAVE